MRSPKERGGPQLLTRRPDLHGRTPHQVQYIESILAHDITFGIGPAGTGKTYLAVACAVDALERDKVKRIVLVRPAVEAGERLGFLPGDLAQKVDPYLRPLYDALYDLMGFDKIGKLLERGTIEIAPLAYMRGRTLNHAFIILDEAQNTTPEQMKMFLTRIGFGAKAVVTGDVTQIDLARGQKSGLIEARRILAERARHRLHRVRRRRRGAPPAGRAHRRCLRKARAETDSVRPDAASRCSRVPRAALPERRARCARWALAAAAQAPRSRCASSAPPKARRLNRAYRGSDYATNVLSLRHTAPARSGDIVLCQPVIAREARAAGQDARRALRAPDGARRAAPARLRPRQARAKPRAWSARRSRILRAPRVRRPVRGKMQPRFPQ